MDIIQMTRELAKGIQKDERYLKYQAVREKSDNDKALQEQIGQFNLMRMNLNQEIAKPEKDSAKIQQMDTELKSLYNTIMESEMMVAFNEAKEDMDSLMNFISQILSRSVAGEDPDTITEESCTHDCSTCGGCH